MLPGDPPAVGMFDMLYAAAEAVQDALMEQARAQEENMQLAHDDLMASLEKGVDHRLRAVNDQVRFRFVEKGTDHRLIAVKN